MTLPRLDLLAEPSGATAAIVLAHGGRQSSQAVPSDWGHPILRMWPFADVARTEAPEALVGLVRYQHRGWNDRSAATDLRRVLDAVGEAGVTTIVLGGHSMGGRAVVATADHPLVTGVLALAPWLPSGEPLSICRDVSSCWPTAPGTESPAPA
ncbi:MAG: alpha/beta hydrolase [Actinomycetota bacterium]|nr:alpha/beta hydrolase [Actinomycetota bacterium]